MSRPVLTTSRFIRSISANRYGGSLRSLSAYAIAIRFRAFTAVSPSS